MYDWRSGCDHSVSDDANSPCEDNNRLLLRPLLTINEATACSSPLPATPQLHGFPSVPAPPHRLERVPAQRLADGPNRDSPPSATSISPRLVRAEAWLTNDSRSETKKSQPSNRDDAFFPHFRSISLVVLLTVLAHILSIFTEK